MKRQSPEADPSKLKAYSAPFPLRGISDLRLAGLDLRVLLCISYHDRMSLKRGKGQGCWASHETLAAEIGCNYINLGKSIKKLFELGYVVRSSPPFGDRRGHVYRIPARLYDYEESLSFGKPSRTKRAQVASKDVGAQGDRQDAPSDCTKAAPFEAKFGRVADLMVCPVSDESLANSTTSSEQYISLSDERYSAETDEIYAPEGAQLASFEPPEPDAIVNVGGQLGRLERAIKSGTATNCGEWYNWLAEGPVEGLDDVNRQWACRLGDQLVDLMDDQE